MLGIGNKIYRNLPEQVAENVKQIAKIWEALDGLDVYDNVIIIETLNPLTPAQLEIVNKPVAFIVYNNVLYMKRGVSASTVYFDQVFAVSADTDEITFASSEIAVSYPLGTLTATTLSAVTYTKTKIDALLLALDTAKADKSDTYTKAESKLAAYPVGSIYTANNNSDSPASLFGGTWQALNSGNPIYLVTTDKSKVITGDNHEYGVTDKPGLSWTKKSDGSTLSATQAIGVGSYFTNYTNTSAATGGVIFPGNLWVDHSDAIAVYMWERVPD